jgi:V/A-type H+-transporting ATPase subunit A
VPVERQKEAFSLVQRLISRDYDFRDKEHAREFFTRLTGLVKNLNYARPDSADYQRLMGEIEELERSVA